ncbi:MAG: cation diffusion facilitator family transporter [Planctomycetota bacterium]
MSATDPHIVRKKTRAATYSILTNSLLVVTKFIVGLAIGSVSVMSEAIHSLVDLVAAVIAWFAVRMSGQPADAKHPYGHGKFENVSGAIEALLIFLAAGWIISEAVHRLMTPSPVSDLGWGFGVMLFSATVNVLISTYLMRVGKETESIALQADAWHLRTDVFTSVGVMLALGVMWLGSHVMPDVDLRWVDPVTAMVVALLIIKAAWDLTWQATGDLLDEGLPPPEVAWIKGFISSQAPRVASCHDMRTRRAGPHRFVEVHIAVDHRETVGQAHELAESIEHGIEAQFPGSTITVHLDPCDASCNPSCLSGCLLQREHRYRLRAERGLGPIDPEAK